MLDKFVLLSPSQLKLGFAAQKYALLYAAPPPVKTIRPLCTEATASVVFFGRAAPVFESLIIKISSI